MSVCQKCNSQSTTFKQGISKKTGKNWSAYKCDDCGEMNWIKSVPSKTENGSQVPQITLLDIKKQLDRIEKLLIGKSTHTEIDNTPF